MLSSNRTCFIQAILLTIFLLTTGGCTSMRSMAASDEMFPSSHPSPQKGEEVWYGTNCIMLDLWHEAKFHLERALKDNPDNILACNNLGVVYEYFGDNEAARRLYEKAVGMAELQGHKGTETVRQVGRDNPPANNLKGFMEEMGQTGTASAIGRENPAPTQLMEETGQTGTASLLTQATEVLPTVPPSSRPSPQKGEGVMFPSSRPSPQKGEGERISSRSVEIKKKLPPVLNIDGINRIGIFVLSDERGEGIIERIVEAFKEGIQEESSFYIDEEVLHENKTAPLARDKSLSSFMENHEAVTDLCTDFNLQGLFVLEITEFNDSRTKMITTKSRYSEEERRYIYYDIPSINRRVVLKMRFCFFEAKTGSLLWDKKYDIAKVKEYPGEDENRIPLYDMELFESLCNEPSGNFITATKPQYRCSKRQVLM